MSIDKQWAHKAPIRGAGAGGHDDTRDGPLLDAAKATNEFKPSKQLVVGTRGS